MESYRLLTYVSALIVAGLSVAFSSTSASGQEMATINCGSFDLPSSTYSVNGGTYKLVPIEESGASTHLIIGFDGSRLFTSNITLSLSGCPSDTFYSGDISKAVSTPLKYYHKGDPYYAPLPGLSSTEQAFYKTNYGTFPSHTVTATVNLNDDKKGGNWNNHVDKGFMLTP